KTEERVKKIISEMPPSQQEKLSAQSLTFYAPGKCDACNGLGYEGRVGIYEIFVVTPQIEQIILSPQVSEYEIQRVAVENGMVTMVKDGILKALEGMTSLEEVFRVADET